MILKVKVQPKSSQRKLEINDDNSYKAYLLSAPTDGKANEELVGLMAKEFKLKKYNIKIIKGEKSKNKIIEIEA